MPTVHAVTSRSRSLAETVRRLLRRGARRNVSRVIGRLRSQDISSLLEALELEEQLQVFRIAVADHEAIAGEVLVEMEANPRQALLEALDPKQIAAVIEPMQVDDQVEIVEALEPPIREKVLELVDVHPEGGDLQTQLTYPDESAGRVMNPVFFTLPESTTVGEAVAKIQEVGEVEMIFYLYVTDAEGALVGVASLRQLLVTSPTRTLGDIMNRSVIHVGTETDQEEVARLASRYGLLAIPVTDEFDRMVGVVTVDDVIDIVQEEADEDFYKMVGTSEDEVTFQERSWRVARIRLPWLFLNLVGLYITGLLFKLYEVTLQEALFVGFFAPVIMGMGGNIGSQTSTIAVRGIATGRLAQSQGRVRPFIVQQIRVGGIIGLVCAPLAAGGAFLIEQNLMFAAVVAVSLFAAVCLASFNGSVVPLLFDRLGIDPAVAAGPMVTTTSDMVGIAVYFAIAASMIEWLIR